MDLQEEETNVHQGQQPYAESSKSQEVVSVTNEDKKEMVANSETEIGVAQEESIGGYGIQSQEEKEVDSRSIYVANVAELCTPEQVQQHFSSCGTVNRVTILIDNYGHSKGYAYVEFESKEVVQYALLLNESELHGRQLKVAPKRTNVPGIFRGRRVTHMGFRHPYYPYGQIPRARFMRYRPY